jgi:1,4-alpha-glucan branching enzyme
VGAANAQRVSVIGSFNDWDGGKHPMQAEENSHWYADVAEAHVGDQYRYPTDDGEGGVQAQFVKELLKALARE